MPSPNLRNRETYAERAWAWDFLNASFPRATRIRIPDVDGCPEYNDHLMMLEGKPSDWAWDWHNGQFRMLRSFAKRPGQIALILCGDNPDDPVVRRLMVVSPLREKTRLIKATTDDVVACVSDWFIHAKGCPDALTSCRYDDDLARALSATSGWDT